MIRSNAKRLIKKPLNEREKIPTSTDMKKIDVTIELLCYVGLKD